MLFDCRVYFCKLLTKFKKEFAAYAGEMSPVRLRLHVLPDASHVWRWFLVEPVSECLGAFGFSLNITKQVGFRSLFLVRIIKHTKE